MCACVSSTVCRVKLHVCVLTVTFLFLSLNKAEKRRKKKKEGDRGVVHSLGCRRTPGPRAVLVLLLDDEDLREARERRQKAQPASTSEREPHSTRVCRLSLARGSSDNAELFTLLDRL